MTDTTPQSIEPGSPLASALFELYSGRPVTVAQAPPGAGKSTLVACTVAHLYRNTDATITVATATNEQGTAIAEQIMTAIGDAPGDGPFTVRVASGKMRVPEGAGSPKDKAKVRAVQVRTAASCKASPPDTDFLIFDEAYQITFADLADGADRARQILTVGDPGQIGPVITVDTTAWSHLRSGPHMRAPDVLAQREDAAIINMPATYRLGPVSAQVLHPLYGWPFESRRPERSLAEMPGEVRTMKLPVRATPYDLESMTAVVQAAVDYIDTTLRTQGQHGTRSQPLDPRDVAIVVSRRAQASAIEALLLERGGGAELITVGTADKLQGGQWHAVVAVDPTLAGAESEHALASGRLCVMASRHMTHLTWVYDDGWPAVLAAAPDTQDAQRAAEVRRGLLAAGQTGAC